METPDLPPASEPRRESPLLPPFFVSPTVFLWLWTLPIAVLLLLNAQGFWLIEGNLSADQRGMAIALGFGVGGNLLAGLVIFGVTRWLERRPGAAAATHFLWGLPAITVQVAYIWWTVSWGEQILPVSVTAWIYPVERFIFNQFAFAMLPLFLGILQMACARPATGVGQIIAVNLGMAVAAPVGLYALFQVLRALQAEGRTAGIVVAIGVVALGILMFFGTVRCLLVLLCEVRTWHATSERLAILVFALVLPVAGLLLNRSIPFPVDFQAWEVYALVVANTAILLLASWRHAAWPRVSFCLLCGTLPFSLYFFIVFLPYTPLSILAVIAMGAGFLVLTPTFLFVLHLYLLNAAWRGTTPGRLRLLAAGVGCGLLLPAFFTGRSLADKAALNAALAHVYSPSIAGGDITFESSRINLRRALGSHRSYKNGIYYPLLSDFYSWVVFDHLVLPDDKLDRLETTFFGRAGSRENPDPVRNKSGFWGRGVRERARMPRAMPVSRSVTVQDLQAGVQAAGDQASVVTLVLTLSSVGPDAAEYRQVLPLPPGIFVNGFRLHINGVAVPGRIVEKKTALWVYTMIRDSERRDPGLLFYNTPEELELCVFPINAGLPVVVEIDFLVPAALSKEMLPTGTTNPATAIAALAGFLRPQMTRNDRGCLVTGGLDELHLPAAPREPYLHLIIDRSTDNGFTGDLAGAIRTLRENFPAAQRARVTLANFNVTNLVAPLTVLREMERDASLARDIRRLPPLSGGFALDLALAHALRQHRDLDLNVPASSGARISPPRPIFVILSRAARPRSQKLVLADAWADLVGAVELHELGAEGRLIVHRPGISRPTPLLRLDGVVRPLMAGRGVRFEPAMAADARLEFWSSEAFAWQPVSDINYQAADTPWSQAVALQFQQQDHACMPGNAGVDLAALVKASRARGILLASTSYIVVENQAQWRMLDLSEHQKLGRNAALDFKETPAPPALWLGLGFGLWLGFRRWRKSSRPACIG